MIGLIQPIMRGAWGLVDSSQSTIPVEVDWCVAMRIKKVKKFQRTFHRLVTSLDFRPPFTILSKFFTIHRPYSLPVDGTFMHAAMSETFELNEQISKILGASCTLSKNIM